jgi:CRISPR-associated protein Csm4
MQIEIWEVSGRSFHFGRHGMGQEATAVHLASDSLFSALTARRAVLRGAQSVDSWTAPFLSDAPPVALSSAFPRAGQVRYYPVPMLPFELAPSAGRIGKELKQAHYLSEALFLQIIQGTSLEQLHQDAVKLMGGSLWTSREEKKDLPPAVAAGREPAWQVVQRPRVTIGRQTNRSNLYFTGQATFHPDCGLWFGARWTNDDAGLRQEMAVLLADLGDAGLGGERSSGFGAAVIRKQGTLELPDSQGKSWVTLSRYLPKRDEISALQHPSAAYAVEPVGGWMQSIGQKAERRQQVNMLSEGSVLGPLPVPIPGQVVDVQPDYNGLRPVGHPVWRSGLALAVGITHEGRAN